jgi:ubiquinone/menaquinone biosynthesis C-methylase UbiE
VADLASADEVPSAAFDCIVLTQTLHLVYDVHSAMRTLYRILAPNGTLLLTVPGISQTTDDRWRDSWYWSFTRVSLTRLANEVFSPEGVEVESHGNVLTAVAFLHGLGRQELHQAELEFTDPDFPLVLTLRARKSEDGSKPK